MAANLGIVVTFVFACAFSFWLGSFAKNKLDEPETEPRRRADAVCTIARRGRKIPTQRRREVLDEVPAFFDRNEDGGSIP